MVYINETSNVSAVITHLHSIPWGTEKKIEHNLSAGYSTKSYLERIVKAGYDIKIYQLLESINLEYDIEGSEERLLLPYVMPPLIVEGTMYRSSDGEVPDELGRELKDDANRGYQIILAGGMDKICAKRTFHDLNRLGVNPRKLYEGLYPKKGGFERWRRKQFPNGKWPNWFFPDEGPYIFDSTDREQIMKEVKDDVDPTADSQNPILHISRVGPKIPIRREASGLLGLVKKHLYTS